MADSLGALTIKFLGDIAEFRTAQQQVLDLSKQTAANVTKAFASVQSSIKATVIGLVSIGSITAIKRTFDDIAKGAAALDDMAERTGATVEALSGLVGVAKLGGHSIETLEGAMLKLTKGLTGADEETKGAGQALSFLGIKARDLEGNLKAPDVLLKEIAKKLDGFQDGAGKSAWAMAAFGKSGAQVLPYLKDLAEQGDLVVKVTAEQAAQAETYEKALKRLEAVGQGWKKEVAFGVLPVANSFVETIITLKKEHDGLTDATKRLRADGSITAWARQGAMDVAIFADQLATFVEVATVVGKSIKNVLADAAYGASHVLEAMLRTGGNGLMADKVRAQADAARAAILPEQQELAKQIKELFSGDGGSNKYANALASQFAKESAEQTEDLRRKLKLLEHGYDAAGKATLKFGGAATDAAKSAAAAAQGLRMALVGLEQKNIQIAFDIDQDKIKSDIAALEDLFKRVGGKDLADQITALQTQATDRFAENVQTRYTALVNALNAEAKRINAMPQDGERDRALEKYVKEYEKLGPLAKELAEIGRASCRERV